MFAMDRKLNINYHFVIYLIRILKFVYLIHLSTSHIPNQKTEILVRRSLFTNPHQFASGRQRNINLPTS